MPAKNPAAKKAAPRKSAKGVSAAEAKKIALSFPGVEEGLSYGQPSFKLMGKFLTRLRDGDTVMVMPLAREEREFLMEMEPETYFVTAHYRDYPIVLIRLANITADVLRHMLETAWRKAAPKKLLKEMEAKAKP